MIFVGADHRGLALKATINTWLTENSITGANFISVETVITSLEGIGGHTYHVTVVYTV